MFDPNAGQLVAAPCGGCGGYGAPAPLGMSGTPSGVVYLIQLTCQRNVYFKSVWDHFCLTQGNGGQQDPTMYDNAFHIKFLEYIAEQAVASGNLNLVAESNNTSGNNKRTRHNDSPYMGGGAPSGDPRKDILVAQVKNFQRIGVQQKELWSLYADTYLQGLRDPARHDANTLEEFCINHGVPPVDPSTVLSQPGACGAPPPVGGGFGAPPPGATGFPGGVPGGVPATGFAGGMAYGGGY